MKHSEIRAKITKYLISHKFWDIKKMSNEIGISCHTIYKYIGMNNISVSKHNEEELFELITKNDNYESVKKKCKAFDFNLAYNMYLKVRNDHNLGYSKRAFSDVQTNHKAIINEIRNCPMISFEYLANKYGLSRERIRQIADKNNVSIASHKITEPTLIENFNYVVKELYKADKTDMAYHNFFLEKGINVPTTSIKFIREEYDLPNYKEKMHLLKENIKKDWLDGMKRKDLCAKYNLTYIQLNSILNKMNKKMKNNLGNNNAYIIH